MEIKSWTFDSRQGKEALAKGKLTVDEVHRALMKMTDERDIGMPRPATWKRIEITEEHNILILFAASPSSLEVFVIPHIQILEQLGRSRPGLAKLFMTGEAGHA